MNITDLIETFTPPPVIESERFTDNRTRLRLLYKEGEERLDALVTPFGENLKEKKDLITYLRFLPNDRILSLTLQDAELDEIVLRDNSKYLTIKHEDKKAVLPFRIYKNIPTKIMPNSFAELVVGCDERVIYDLIKLLELSYDMKHGKSNFDKIKEVFDGLEDLIKYISESYKPLRKPVMDAFKNDKSPSKKLHRLSRKPKHYTWKNVESYCSYPKSKKDLLILTAKKQLIYNPVKHFVYSTEENKNFAFPRSKKKIKEYKAFLDYLKSDSPKAYSFLKESFLKEEKNAAKIYHKYLIIGAIGALVTGNFILSGGLFGGYILEKIVSNLNARTLGYHTGIIGTLRDKLGLTKEIISPFDMIDEKYNLGMWTKNDLE